MEKNPLRRMQTHIIIPDQEAWLPGGQAGYNDLILAGSGWFDVPEHSLPADVRTRIE